MALFLGYGGRGNRQLLNKWFNKSDFISLAVTGNSYFAVKDLIKLGHVKGKDEGADTSCSAHVPRSSTHCLLSFSAHKIMVSYFLHGYKKTKANRVLSKSLSPAIGYLDDLAALKRSLKRPLEAARLVRKRYFPLHVVPSEVRYHPEVRLFSEDIFTCPYPKYISYLDL